MLVLDRRVTAQFEGRRWTLPARVYAQPVELYVGQTLSAERCAQELERLGYHADAEPDDSPGTYRRRGDRVDVDVRGFRFSDEMQNARELRLGFAGDAIVSLEDAQGRDVPVYRLDPLLIGSIFPLHGEDRIVVAPGEVPPLLPAALKAVEDRTFDEHHGVNPKAILRALFANVRAGQIEQGGSTLTQQLVKSYFLDSRRTLRRKSEEAVMAMILESRFEKADIMNAYINEIYLGQDGRRAVHGFGLASQFYFGKPLSELESAGDRAARRGRARTVVLRPASASRAHARASQPRAQAARRAGRDRAEAAESAAKRPLGLADAKTARLDLLPCLSRSRAPPAAPRLRGRRPDRGRPRRVHHARSAAAGESRAGTRRRARSARRNRSARRSQGLEGVDRRHVPADRRGPQRGRRPRRIASMASTARSMRRRPIGSIAKPLVYLAALEQGTYTPATFVHDEPVQLKLPNGQTWKPENFTKTINGPVPMVRALTQSLNLATVNLGLEVGLDKVADTYVQLGLEQAPAAFPSMLLGAANLSPFDVAQMYNTLANGGFRSPLRAVRAVLDENGKALKAPELEIDAAGGARRRLRARPDADRGHGPRHGSASAQGSAAGHHVAGKTGTSNDYRDSWFAGFSGSHLIVVWVGHDDNSSTGLTGTTGALPVWSKLMGSLSTHVVRTVLPEDRSRSAGSITTAARRPLRTAAEPRCAWRSPVGTPLPPNALVRRRSDEGDWPMIRPPDEPPDPGSQTNPAAGAMIPLAGSTDPQARRVVPRSVARTGPRVASPTECV